MKVLYRNMFVTVVLVFLATIVVYWAEQAKLPHFELFRYLYFIPILFSALTFDFAGAVYASVTVVSLYIPILFLRLESRGVDDASVELFITLMLFVVIGVIVGIASGNERRKRETYQALSELGNIISYSFTIDKLLPEVLNTIVRVTESARGAIVFIDTEKEFFTLLDSNNQVQKIRNNSDTPLHDLLTIKKPFFINNIAQDERLLVSDDMGEFVSMMVSPIIVKDRTIGLVIVEDKVEEKRYATDNAQLLFTIATQLGANVTNLKLYELAVIDGLTQTYTHRFFQNKLKEELKQKPVSLLLADIDHFKSVNDTYGHPEGDVVLKQVAKIMQEVVGDMGEKNSVLFSPVRVRKKH
ncbi:MAG: diguanylate cyclase [Patescibacteria group bacterium]